MSALRKILVVENEPVASKSSERRLTVLPSAAEMLPEVAAAAKPGIARSSFNIAMFFAAPFVALAYVALLPFVGLGMLAWVGGKAFFRRMADEASMGRKIARFSYNVGMFFAAPFVALAYVVLLPPMGLGMLAWTGGKALLERSISH
jgi:energy-converting hydrogenase Eha subunit A